MDLICFAVAWNRTPMPELPDVELDREALVGHGAVKYHLQKALAPARNQPERRGRGTGPLGSNDVCKNEPVTDAFGVLSSPDPISRVRVIRNLPKRRHIVATIAMTASR